MILGEVDDFARDLVPDSWVEPHQRPLFDDVELHGLIIPEEERHELCEVAADAAFYSSKFLSAPRLVKMTTTTTVTTTMAISEIFVVVVEEEGVNKSSSARIKPFRDAFF